MVNYALSNLAPGKLRITYKSYASSCCRVDHRDLREGAYLREGVRERVDRGAGCSHNYNNYKITSFITIGLRVLLFGVKRPLQ